MGNISVSAVLGAGHPQSAPLLTTLLEDHTINPALCNHNNVQQFPHQAALSLLPEAKRSRQDCLTTTEMIADGCMQRGEFKQRLIGGDSKLSAVIRDIEADGWKCSSLQDPWLVETVRASPWHKWSLTVEEEDLTELPIPHVGSHPNVTGLCQKCFHTCEHHICTECGISSSGVWY